MSNKTNSSLSISELSQITCVLPQEGIWTPTLVRDHGLAKLEYRANLPEFDVSIGVREVGKKHRVESVAFVYFSDHRGVEFHVLPDRHFYAGPIESNALWLAARYLCHVREEIQSDPEDFLRRNACEIRNLYPRKAA